MSNDMPLVSVVTPVYNGEKYLTKCIESVLEQTYRNFEYIVVNNCSTDKSLQIAEHYAKKGHRIRIYNNKKFLSALENSNHALRQIAKESKYCKIVHADDWIYPECIEKMVALAENYPSIGVVGAYILTGAKVQCAGLPYTDKVIPGKEICRSRLLGGPYLFGSPTSTLIRADIVRSRKNFYNKNSLHSDVEVMFEILQDFDFGFVHQVLTFTRIHDESRTATIAKRFNTNRLEGLAMLKKYGPVFLTSEECEYQFNKKLDQYYQSLAYKPSRLLKKKFIEYQQEELEKIGYRLSLLKFFNTMLCLAVNRLAVPVKRLFD